MARRDARLHWGYAVVAARFAAYFISTGLTKSLSIFIPHLVVLLGTTYATIGLVCGLPDSLGYLSGPLVSYAITKFSPRFVGMTGGVLAGVGILGATYCNDVFALGTCMTITGLGAIMVNLPIATGLNQHFPVKFGVANAFGIVGAPTGAFMLPVITERFLELYGLRGAMMILSAFCFNSVVCAAVLKPPRRSTRSAQDVKLRPAEKSTCNDGDNTWKQAHGAFDETDALGAEQNDNDGTRFSKHKGQSRSYLTLLCDLTNFTIIRKQPIVLFLLLADFLMMVVWIGWTLFLVPHAESLGIEQSQAVYLATSGGIGGVIGLLVSSVILYFKPKISLKMSVVLSFLCSCVFFTEYASNSFAFLSCHAFIIGYFVYQQFSVVYVIIKDALPEEDFPMGMGLSLFAIGIGSIFGSFCSGLVYDLTHSYHLLFISFGVVEVLTFACYLGYMMADKYLSCRPKTQIEEANTQQCITFKKDKLEMDDYTSKAC